MTEPSRGGAQREDVVCPFCGLGCDDVALKVDGNAVEAVGGACAGAAALFRRGPEAPPKPRIDGRDVSIDEAVAAAAALLVGARSAVYAGLGADVEGVRAVLKLAAKTGGSVDHHASAGLFRNLSTSQRRGWIATTIAETRNRADLVVVVGPDPIKAYEQVYLKVTPAGGLFFEGQRRVVFLGAEPAKASLEQLKGSTVETVRLGASALVDELSRLGTLVAGGTPAEGSPEVDALAEALKAAKYPVLIWSAASMDADGDLVVERACAVVDALNVEGRAACLPLSGKDNITGAYHVSLWNIGFPLRVGFRGRVADHDQAAYSTETAAKTADVVVWTSAFRPERPPASGAKLIAIAHPSTKFEREPDVFIPVGQPGLDHAGLVFRADSVVGLPLRKHRDAGLVSVADAVNRIAEARP